MSDQKYCPNCQKLQPIDSAVCDQCGYEFVIVEKKDENVSTNTKTFVDPIPLWIWKLISYVCPVAGLVLYIVWLKKYPERSRAAGKAALTMTIILVVVIVIIIALAIGFKNGQVV